MSILKGYCPYCQNANDQHRIFEMNSEAVKTFCPHCLKEMSVSFAHEQYKKIINKYLAKADFKLYISNKIVEAYQTYAYVLELEKDNIRAFLGRLLSLAYLSTLRKSMYKETYSMWVAEKELFRDASNKDLYIRFLLSLNRNIQEYRANLAKKLAYHGCFYDIECVSLYLERIKEIYDLKKLVIQELTFVKAEKLALAIKDELSVLEELLHAKLLAGDGYYHTLLHFDKNNVPILTNGVEKRKTPLDGLVLFSLNGDRKHRFKIRDNMFRSNLALYHLSLIALPIAILFILIGSVFATSLSFHADNSTLYVFSLIAMCISYSVTIASIILLMCLKKHLTKRRF